MTIFSIPQAALDAQATATHPTTSVWVSANAGSGKTHVLSERVIRLLLNGTPPARILCLTYTKAAAAVMQSRIFRTLSSWSELDDHQLQTILSRLENKPVNAQKLTYARQLFARALETPGGLKIQTIHAFCEALLHQFSLEANIAGHFELLDDISRKKLLQQARCQLLIHDDAQSLLKQLFKIISEETFNQLLHEATQKQHEFSDFLSFILYENGEEQLRQLFNLAVDETHQRLLEKIKQTALLSPHAMKYYQTNGNSKAKNIIADFLQLVSTSDEENIITLVSNIYLTTTGKPRDFSRLFSNKSDEIWPFVQKEIEKKQNQLSTLLEKYQCVQLVTLNMAVFQLCSLYLKIYADLKKANGLLDFDDLIERTLHLLQRRGASQWVQYKLDHGIDHILLDEAQDTNPAQWQIIQLLAKEFFTGDSQRTNTRTIFAVGDEKQSIYSFQGAEPENFAKNGRMIQKQIQHVNEKFEKIQLHYSFRSTADVLKSVDLVFETPENYKGLSADNAKTVHEPIRVNSPGDVIVWDVISKQTSTLPDDWHSTVDHLDTPEVRLADKIATTIADWLQKGEMLPAKGRLLRASDIMILVRKRDQFVPALSRALKLRNIPVAGADRLQLTSHISVQDLMALARFVLHPKDDLSLACVLKSPLFALSEEALYQLAAQRTGSLWQSLNAHASSHDYFKEIFENLSKYRALVDQIPVFEFYSHILNNDKGRQKILARLGPESNEVLDAFMDYTLTIQKTGLPGLQAFLETLSKNEPEIKRELDQNHEEVRIMTVHAAKGLEASVVFLVDSGSAIWNSHYAPHFFKLPLNGKQAFIWRPNAEFKTKPFEKALSHLKESAEEEYRRLLYVGMTRAEDRLIICGYSQKREVPNTWLHLVKNALKPYAVPTKGPADDIAAWRYSITPSTSFPIDQKILGEASQEFPPLPAFFHHKIPAESALPKILKPSVTNFATDTDSEIELFSAQKILNVSPILEAKNTNKAFSIEYGNLIHKLLQYLPDCPPEKRQDYAQQYLNIKASHWDDTKKNNALHDIWAILDNPHLKLLFSDSSRAEVSLMGIVKIRGKEQMISGRIDRLCITQDCILFADFKTGTPPEDETAITQNYWSQMALYRKMLQTIYPEKTIQAFLIYSQGAKIFTLLPKKLDTLLDEIAL
ncbi:double-strand break repair helicase AddA [Bartonella bacilliformis]|uniref:DNA 3'-5' helicase n=2 Tax=Bartonella bacilliformis TaxID=774 RepID=A1UUF1_BARBK|nr:double-strand break repair helicase AddA [Bartonella bacilliformis]ABM44610.1 double-strand break repair helicase AddA [Bartonella bacilliformis KC583]AMG85223.1 double-strand break repair helicase AddA [Bartonella bacilliformis]EKS42918.1 double-strand break repair helicase AddA [Bartonella bacilliformis INS]EYS88879.1 double-strand break repair helicase AddA [Bartonella bacilliformis San Pedro600-02]KZN22290.1 double-strand break repair helicase AddA [Bartonella bacilliformis]